MITVNGLEELKALVGQDLGHSSWLEVTQERVNTFADATGDHQWIHVDVERAKAGPFGGPIAHGYLTLSLIPFLGAGMLPVKGVTRGINYGSDKVRFINMVRVGKRVRMRQKLIGAEPKAGGMQIKNECTIEIEGEAKPACIAEIQALDALYDRLSPGGVIVFDDYGWAVARRQKDAEDQWFAARGLKILQLPTGQGLFIKP